MPRIRSAMFVLICSLAFTCHEKASILITEDVEIKARPVRSHTADNPTIGTARSGALFVDAVIFEGQDYYYDEVPIGDGGFGYVRPDSHKIKRYP
jgi:hypothetical protein